MSQTLGELLREHQNERSVWVAGPRFENDFGMPNGESLPWWIHAINNFQSGALMQRNAQIFGAVGSRSIGIDMGVHEGMAPLLNEDPGFSVG